MSKLLKFVKSNWLTIVFVLFGGLLGFIGGVFLLPLMEGKSAFELILLLSVTLLSLIASVFLQVLLHEGGHLVAGLISGYKFLSFRIAGIMLTKDEGKLHVKRFSIPGTGGQCLMEPPPYKEQDLPYIFFNLAGSLTNLITAALFALLAVLAQGWLYLNIFLVLLAVMGLLLALQNGVPLRFNGLNNDAMNVLQMHKSQKARRSFWTQLQVNALAARGLRLREMPAELFYLPNEAGLKNNIEAPLALMYCSYLIDTGRFDEARLAADKVLGCPNALMNLLKDMLACDRLFLELVGNNNEAKVQELRSESLLKFMRVAGSYLSVLRTRYAYELLSLKDKAEAQLTRETFARRCASWPVKSEIQSELELLALASSKADIVEDK